MQQPRHTLIVVNYPRKCRQNSSCHKNLFNYACSVW